MTLITTQDALDAACDRFSRAEFLTVDTEFLRESTYYSKLCLIQVASDDEAVAIDPLSDDIDLDPFFDLMADTKILKVMHACRQDVEIFFDATEEIPAPLFDTQIAAMVCGFGESVGYETLVNKIVGTSIDKSTRYTDWSQRPLTDQQIQYALSDVTHLRTIYRRLSKDLEKSGRAGWLAEEMAVCTAPDTYRIDPYRQWEKLKARTNKPRMLGVLREIAAWRELNAQERDMPRRRVLKDEVLLELAAKPPQSADQMERMRTIPNGFARSRAGKSLLEAIKRALALPDEDMPVVERAKPRAQTPPIADLLKVLLKLKCQGAGVATKLVANAADIEAWSADPKRYNPAFMEGWRKSLFGDDALKLMQGDLALASNNGQIEIVELEPPEID